MLLMLSKDLFFRWSTQLNGSHSMLQTTNRGITVIDSFLLRFSPSSVFSSESLFVNLQWTTIGTRFAR